MFIYFWETDRLRAGEGQTERETQNPKQAPGSELSAQSPMWAPNLEYDIMTWAKVGSLTDWTTQAPLSLKNLETHHNILVSYYFFVCVKTENVLFVMMGEMEM